ncbi:hypothetical protein ACFYYM_31210 [Streptomyces erythrochromogenes]|uniref:hypothetical protein n=1 Tax=Streptomyces erythrochromogenes TaxID=285574 RepID=UPI0036BB9B48
MDKRDVFTAAVQRWVERDEANDPWTDPLKTDKLMKKALGSYKAAPQPITSSPEGPTPQQQWKWLQDFLAKTSRKEN